MIVLTIIVFIVVLGGLVLLHEIGHFVSARLFGVGIDEFGIGFPPRARSFVRNGVVYSLNWIPVGGFVKIKGAIGGDQDDDQHASLAEGKNFIDIALWKRFTIIVAGIAMNLAVAVVLFSIGFMIGLPSSTSTAPDTASITDPNVTVASIQSDAPVANENIATGDVLVAIADQSIENVEELRTALSTYTAGETIDAQIERGEDVIDVRLTTTTVGDGDTGLGVAFVETGIVRLPFFHAIYHGIVHTVQLTRDIFMAFIGLLVGLFSGESSAAESVSGPLGIATLTYEVTQLGVVYIIQFAALLSINLAIFNLLPFPALDGGRLAFILVEAVTRKPVKPQTEAIIHNIGFMVLLLLILAVTVKDVFTLF